MSSPPDRSVTVFHIRTAALPQVRIGVAGSQERAEQIAVAALAAMRKTVEVVPVVTPNPVWAVPEYRRLADEPYEPVPDYTGGGPVGSAYPRRAGES